MNDFSPTKSSSRAGRFKKKLVSEEVLLIEAPFILNKVAPFHELFVSGQITQSDFIACYIIAYLSHRFPGTWLGSKRSFDKTPGPRWRDYFEFEPNIERRLKDVHSVYDIFLNFSLKSTPSSVNRAIIEWKSGNYQLELMFRIPQPREVLHQQKYGRRCVTAFIDHRLSKYILGERDGLSFTMHDLIHADHFFHHNDCYQGQLAFYGLLDKTFSYFDLSNQAFASEFEYLISDMNAYAIHLLKCLKSAMIHYFNQDHFNGWLTGLDAPPALYALNTSSYSPVPMDSEILSWINQFRQS